ncbi:MAG: LVIVD repeat-containing protein [Promethearchaeota archaeon]
MIFKLGYKKLVITSIVILTLAIPFLSINCRAQTSQTLYLNSVGMCDIEVGYDVQVHGNYAYVTNNDGLMVIDVSNPSNPNKVGELLCGGAFGIDVSSNLVYIASVSNGMIIADISNPTNPVQLGQYSGGAYRIAVSDPYAYVGDFNGGFTILNISDSTNPVLVGAYSDPRCDAIEFKDNFVYYANAEQGLKVVSVSNPSTPQLVRTVSQTGGGNDIHITNDTLFLACWGAGIRVIDISNPTAPLMLDSYDDNDGGEELGLIERNGYLYVADNSGVEIFNISNPNSIVEIAQRTSGVGAAHDIDVDDEYVYVAQAGGLLILEVSETPQNGDYDFLFYLTIIIAVIATVTVISIVFYFKIYKPRKVITEEN